MNSPTHEEISYKAYALWEKHGRPHGTHDEIWLEAESQLQANAANHDHSSAAVAPAAVVPSHAIAPTPVEQKAIIQEVQKQAARAPQVPHQNAPKPQPAPSGKPVWKQAHSA